MDINYEALVDVFTGNLWEAELIKGLLESEGVQSMIKNEGTSTCWTSPYSVVNEVKVLVNKEEEVYAKEVIAKRKK